MSAPRKFDEETRARAVRLYQDRLRDHPDRATPLAGTGPAPITSTEWWKSSA